MRKKILIVDDEQEVLNLLEKGLLREGFAVITASSGQAAKDIISSENPDVIILDLVMPKMSGWEVLRWLREDKKLTTPTIIVSAKDEIADMKKGYSLAADTYLTKPVSIDDLLRGINAVCALET